MSQKYHLAEECTIGDDTTFYLIVADDGRVHVESNTSCEQPYKTDSNHTYQPPEFSGRVVNGKSLATLVAEKLATISN